MTVSGAPDLSGFALRPAAEPDEIDSVERVLGTTFPEDYRAMLRQSDGLEGFAGIDAYLILWPVGDLPGLNDMYGVKEFAPGLILIGTDGGDTGYGFAKGGDESGFVRVPLVGMSREAVSPMGLTLVEMMKRLRAEQPS